MIAQHYQGFILAPRLVAPHHAKNARHPHVVEVDVIDPHNLRVRAGSDRRGFGVTLDAAVDAAFALARAAIDAHLQGETRAARAVRPSFWLRMCLVVGALARWCGVSVASGALADGGHREQGK